jgi:hypothetical protein
VHEDQQRKPYISTRIGPTCCITTIVALSFEVVQANIFHLVTDDCVEDLLQDGHMASRESMCINPCCVCYRISGAASEA